MRQKNRSGQRGKHISKHTAAERRLRLARDQVGADAETVNVVALLLQRVEHVLVQVVAGDDLQVAKVDAVSLGRLRQEGKRRVG